MHAMADRHPLLVLRYVAAGRDVQLCQVRVDCFESKEQVLAILTKLAEAIVAGEVQLDNKDALYRMRDELVLQAGGHVAKRGRRAPAAEAEAQATSKRPVAATTSKPAVAGPAVAESDAGEGCLQHSDLPSFV